MLRRTKPINLVKQLGQSGDWCIFVQSTSICHVHISYYNYMHASAYEKICN